MAYFLNIGFVKCIYVHPLFVKVGNKVNMFIICNMLDDIIFIRNCIANV